MIADLVSQIKDLAVEAQAAAVAFDDAGEKKVYKEYKTLREFGQKLKLLGQKLRVQVSEAQKAKK